MRPLFAFVFPSPEGGDFRCLRTFTDVDAACEWAVSMLTEGEFCFLSEVPSCTYVFEPVRDPHFAVSLHPEGWDVLEVID